MIKTEIKAGLSYESAKELYKFLIKEGFSVDMTVKDNITNIKAEKQSKEEVKSHEKN